jgi:hypothetical protein
VASSMRPTSSQRGGPAAGRHAIRSAGTRAMGPCCP